MSTKLSQPAAQSARNAERGAARGRTMPNDEVAALTAKNAERVAAHGRIMPPPPADAAQPSSSRWPLLISAALGSCTGALLCEPAFRLFGV